MIFSLSFHLQLVGVATIILGAVNFGWPRLLGWSADLAAARPLTRQMIHSQTYYIGLTCVILGFAPLVLTAELLTPSRLSTAILAARDALLGNALADAVRRFPAPDLADLAALHCRFHRIHPVLDVDRDRLRGRFAPLAGNLVGVNDAKWRLNSHTLNTHGRDGIAQ
ncbi:hypothetical protein [Fodinicola feengrottensis]|uniref:hypothetical protein n=1 Tax=Fodinicola feengrottensis TaxID=435914 RepID=UPI0013D3F647|nr:hypothetical protein [Fodinicola feengrottensis]